MILTAADYIDRDLAGRPARTMRLRFGSQQEQVYFLRKMVTAARQQLAIREKAVEIVQEAGVPPRRKTAQAFAIGRWAKDGGIYYVNEPVEIFQLPTRTIRSGIGDCDDFTTAIGSLCESIGIPTRLVAMSVRPMAPASFRSWFAETFRTEDRGLTHIYPEAWPVVMGRRVRICLDATGDFPVGTDPIALALRRGRFVRTFAV